jgi:hypothetical protein
MDRHYQRYELLRPLVGYFKHINDPGLLKFMVHIRGLNLRMYEKTYDFRVLEPQFSSNWCQFFDSVKWTLQSGLHGRPVGGDPG